MKTMMYMCSEFAVDRLVRFSYVVHAVLVVVHRESSTLTTRLSVAVALLVLACVCRVWTASPRPLIVVADVAPVARPQKWVRPARGLSHERQRTTSQDTQSTENGGGPLNA